MTQADRPLSERLPRRRRNRLAVAAAALGATLLGGALTPTEAQAGGVPRVLRPGTRPMQFLFGFGPAWGIGGSAYYYGGAYWDGYCGPGNGNNCFRRGWGGYGAFKLTQEFNGHFSGNASGPALGVLLNQEFSGGYFGFSIAPKFTYDIQPKRDLGLYISPNISFGYQLMSYRPYYFGDYLFRYNYHAANLQFGMALKLMLDDRWIVWLQFPHFDMIIGPGYGYGCGGPVYCPAFFATRLNLLAGAGVSF